MALAGTINARLDESLKRHGGQVLDRNGLSATEAIRRLYQYLEREQRVPSWMLDDAGSCEETARKRLRLRQLVGSAPLEAGCDARAEYRAHALEKCAPGVRE